MCKLRSHAQLEHYTVKDFALFLLQAMLAVATQKRRRTLWVSDDHATALTGYLKLELPTTMYDNLFDLAGSFGLKVPALSRVLLQMGLDFYEKHVPRTRIVSKEEFAKIIKAELDKETPLTIH